MEMVKVKTADLTGKALSWAFDLAAWHSEYGSEPKKPEAKPLSMSTIDLIRYMVSSKLGDEIEVPEELVQ